MNNYCFTARDSLGNFYEFEKEKITYGLRLILKKEKIKMVSNIFALGEFTEAKVGDEGYYVIPRNISQKADVLTRFEKRDDCVHEQNRPIMSFVGIKKRNFCCIARVVRSYEIGFVVTVKNGVYNLEIVFNTEKDYIDPAVNTLPYDIEIEIVFLDKDADYNDMAKKERDIRLERGEITSLREKCRNDAVEYARLYPLIRIRQAWKRSPSVIKHQTPENEPPLKVACDFKRCREIADECKKQGVEGAEFQLVGWSVGGHDGRFPQVFPVEEKLGGMEEFKKTVDYIKFLGYRISTHTNLQDAYEIAENFSWDDLAEDEEGKNFEVVDSCSGIAYYLCETVQEQNVKKYYPDLAELGENGLHFTDVISITAPHACHNAFHPLTFKQAVDLRLQAIKYQKELFGGFSSEGVFDYTLKYLDYGLYICFGGVFGNGNVSVASENIHLWEIAYHGIVLYNPMSATINYPIKTPADRLRFVMSGGRPSFYFYSKFRDGAVNWMGETDLTCDGEEDLKKSVSHIKSSLDEYESLRRLQLEYIERYDVSDDGIEKVEYSDGTRIVGNFNNFEVVFNGKTIKPFNYLIETN